MSLCQYFIFPDVVEARCKRRSTVPQAVSSHWPSVERTICTVTRIKRQLQCIFLRQVFPSFGLWMQDSAKKFGFPGQSSSSGRSPRRRILHPVQMIVRGCRAAVRIFEGSLKGSFTWFVMKPVACLQLAFMGFLGSHPGGNNPGSGGKHILTVLLES